ncbi:MAG: sigma factor [Clostridiales bacterium]|nr:sigma factor [Clostridiales bacterium]
MIEKIKNYTKSGEKEDKFFMLFCNEFIDFVSYRCQGGEGLVNIEQLYRMYFKDVYLYLRAITKNQDLAEELTQETFFKALKGIGNE